MKVYIFCDLEGVSGIPAGCFISGERPELRAVAARCMAGDINACIAGCFEAGAEEVVVRDGHGAGFNVNCEMIDARAELVQGASPQVRFPGIEGAGALILLGYHAMAGTEGAVLEHTFSSATIQNMWLNGRKVGELGIDAAIAAEHGVPVVLVTGDDKCCREAQEHIPGVAVCCVKQGLSTQGARMLSPARAQEKIRCAAADALRRLAEFSPVRLNYPATLRWELVERQMPPGGPEVVRIDGRTYEKSGISVERLLIG